MQGEGPYDQCLTGLIEICRLPNARRWLHRAILRRDIVKTKGRAGCEKWMETYPGTKGPAEKLLPWTSLWGLQQLQETGLSLPPNPAQLHSACG